MSDATGVLADVACVIGRGITPKYTDGEGVTVLNQRCVRDGRVDPSLARTHDAAARPVRPDKFLLCGDILVNSTGVGTLGRTAFVPQAAAGTVVDSHLMIIRPSETTDPRWLGYALRLNEPQIEAMAEGSTGQTELSRGRLSGLKLYIPNPERQRRIAATLCALDDKIDSNSRAIDVLMHLLDGMSARLGPVLPSICLRELAAVPRIAAKPSEMASCLVDHYSLPAFDSGRLPDRVPASEIMSNKLSVLAPSVLVSRLNPRINRTWFAVPESGFPALASTEFMILEPRDVGELGGLWLAVRDESFISEFVSRVTGTSGSHQRIRPDDALSIGVPDVRQLNAPQRAEASALLLSMHQKQIESQRLARLRDTLLPGLMSGHICLSSGPQVAESFT